MSLDDCIMFSQKNVPDGYFQLFLDVVSYYQFVTDKIIDVERLKISTIQELRLCQTAQKPAVVSLFWASVPPMFAGSKESRDSRDPLSGLKTPENLNPYYSVHGLFTRANNPLKVKR